MTMALILLQNKLMVKAESRKSETYNKRTGQLRIFVIHSI